MARNHLKQEQGVVVEKMPQLMEKEMMEWPPLPQFISLFLPEFPVQPLVGQRQLKVGVLLGLGVRK